MILKLPLVPHVISGKNLSVQNKRKIQRGKKVYWFPFQKCPHIHSFSAHCSHHVGTSPCQDDSDSSSCNLFPCLLNTILPEHHGTKLASGIPLHYFLLLQSTPANIPASPLTVFVSKAFLSSSTGLYGYVLLSHTHIRGTEYYMYLSVYLN